MWTSAARKALAVRTIVPMLKSCCQFSIATWKSWRRVSRSATIDVERPVAVAVDDVAAVAVAQQVRVPVLTVGQAPSHGPTPTSGGPCGIGSYGARWSSCMREQ